MVKNRKYLDMTARLEHRSIGDVMRYGTMDAGLNYYFNGHRMKLQTDWIALMPYNFDFGEAAHVVHLQLDVTF